MKKKENKRREELKRDGKNGEQNLRDKIGKEKRAENIKKEKRR